MSEPLVSLIIPTKNDMPLFKRCLESVRKQTYKNIELIVVDAHSTDGTDNAAKEAGADVIYESTGTRGGACNIGVQAAKGDIILFTDADCVVPEDWVATHVKLLTESPENVAGVGGPNETPKDDTPFARAVGFLLDTTLAGGFSTHGRRLDEPVEVVSLPGCNASYRAEILKDTPFNETLRTVEDTEMNSRIRKKGHKLIYHPKTSVLHYRRSTPRTFYRQIYMYGLGRVQGIRVDRDLFHPVHIVPPLYFLTLIISAVLGITPLTSILLSIGALLLIGFPLYALVKEKDVIIAANVLLALVLEVAAWTLGSIHGIFYEPTKKVA